MRDWSINLPTWALEKGYTLMGYSGQYDDLELWKRFDLIKRFEYYKVPNIFEMEDIIEEVESCRTQRD